MQHQHRVLFRSGGHSLTLSTLGKIFSRGHLDIAYFLQKTGFDISCKLSPMGTICMKCQILFSRINDNLDISTRPYFLSLSLSLSLFLSHTHTKHPRFNHLNIILLTTDFTSRKHAYIILTPLNPTFIK